MSTENISTASHRQGKFQIATQHQEAVVRHAVRNIKHASKLCDNVFNKYKTFTTRLQDKPELSHNGLKHHWS